MPWCRLAAVGHSPGGVIAYLVLGLLWIPNAVGQPTPTPDHHQYYHGHSYPVGHPYPHTGEVTHDPWVFSHGPTLPWYPSTDPYHFHPAPTNPEPKKPVKPTPVPIYYSVPIPWPTPCDDTTQITTPPPLRPTVEAPRTLPLSDDTYPLYIPIPRFQYVPYYYKVSPHEPPCHPPPHKPDPKPEPHHPTKPERPPPRPESPLKKHTEEVTPINPICDALPPSSKPQPPSPIIPPPHHTWVPPPKTLPSYIPPSQSDLHTRSLSSRYSPTYHYDYPTYGGPYSSDPYYPSIDHYYSKSYNPYNFQYSYYYAKSPSSPPDDPGYKIYGPETVTFTEPAPASDGYITYGPEFDTITEDQYYQTPWSHPAYIWGGSPPRAPAPPPPQPLPPPPPRPSPPVGIGSRTSVAPPSPPSGSKDDLNVGYVLYEPETFVIKDDHVQPDKSILYGPQTFKVVDKGASAGPPSGYFDEKPDTITFQED